MAVAWTVIIAATILLMLGTAGHPASQPGPASTPGAQPS